MVRPLNMLFFVVVLAPLILRADSITLNNKLAFNDVRILGVNGDLLLYQTATGNQASRPMAEIAKIILNDEPVFSAAEESYQAKEWDKAAAGYERALASTAKPWLKEWCTLRLLDSANKGGRFDAAVKGFIVLAEKDPTTARNLTLSYPKRDSQYITQGITLLNTALDKTRRNEVRAVLLKVLIDLHDLKGDLKSKEEALAKATEVEVALNPSSPAAQRMLIRQKLNAARKALAAKDPDGAIKTIDSAAGEINDPADQVEALLCLADAHFARAVAKEPADWKGVAIAYMRIPSHAPGTPQSAEALLKVAGILETRLNDRDGAMKLLQQVSVEFKDQEAAKAAEKELQRLRQG